MPSSKPTPGVNDLATCYPDIAREAYGWDPASVRYGSSKKLLWKCSKGHVFECPVKVRTHRGTNCTICSGKQILPGFNDLATLCPSIAAEWHPKKNAELTPDLFFKASNTKVWWQCSTDPNHQWEASIAHRTRDKPTGCPICSGQSVLPGSNDLQTTDPHIAKEWHPDKNGLFLPSQFTRSSNKEFWWQCLNHRTHIWRASINNRTSGRGCPICGNKKVIAGFNDFATQRPDLLEEWHPIKNKTLLPTQFSEGSRKKVWWQCRANTAHEWEAIIGDRTKKDGTGCPICAGQLVVKGLNDLETTDPDIAKEWHPTKNLDLLPSMFARSSNKRIWWQCFRHPEHEWKTSINNRTNNRGCPSCAQYGFSPSKPAYLYLMSRPGEQQFGITNKLQQRIDQHARDGWILLDHIGPASGSLVLQVETSLRKWLKHTVGAVDGTKENWSSSSLEIQSLAELKKISGIQTDLF